MTLKLKSLNIKKLFDSYSYDLDFNIASNISIMYGENGCGKTTILQMIDAICSNNYFLFFTWNFQELEFHFCNDLEDIMVQLH